MARRTLPFRSVLAALVVVVVAGGVVLAGSGLRPKVTSADDDAYVKSTAVTYLPVAAMVKKTVVSVTLPAGIWILTAEATLVTRGQGQVVRCGVFAGGQALQQTARDDAAAVVDEIGALGIAKMSSSFVASFRCWQDGAVSGLRNYIDPGAALWAHKSDTASF